MEYKPEINAVSVRRRGTVPVLSQTFSGELSESAAEQIMADCIEIIKTQTELARDSKSVQRVNESLDAANKAMRLATAIRKELPAAGSAVLHNFISLVARKTEMILRADLYREYLLYCDITGNFPYSKTKFFDDIIEFGVKISRRGNGKIKGVVAILPRVIEE